MASVLFAKYNIISQSVTLFIDDALLTAYELLLKIYYIGSHRY